MNLALESSDRSLLEIGPSTIHLNTENQRTKKIKSSQITDFKFHENKKFQREYLLCGEIDGDLRVLGHRSSIRRELLPQIVERVRFEGRFGFGRRTVSGSAETPVPAFDRENNEPRFHYLRGPRLLQKPREREAVRSETRRNRIILGAVLWIRNKKSVIKEAEEEEGFRIGKRGAQEMGESGIEDGSATRKIAWRTLPVTNWGKGQRPWNFYGAVDCIFYPDRSLPWKQIKYPNRSGCIYLDAAAPCEAHLEPLLLI